MSNVDKTNWQFMGKIAYGLPMTDEGLFKYCDLTKKFDITMNFINEGATVPMHVHEKTVFNLVLDGDFEVRIGDEPRTYSKGHWINIPKDVQHSVTAKTKVVLLELWEK